MTVFSIGSVLGASENRSPWETNHMNWLSHVSFSSCTCMHLYDTTLFTNLIIIIKQAFASTKKSTLSTEWRIFLIFHFWWFEHLILIILHCNYIYIKYMAIILLATVYPTLSFHFWKKLWYNYTRSFKNARYSHLLILRCTYTTIQKFGVSIIIYLFSNLIF